MEKKILNKSLQAALMDIESYFFEEQVLDIENMSFNVNEDDGEVTVELVVIGQTKKQKQEIDYSEVNAKHLTKEEIQKWFDSKPKAPVVFSKEGDNINGGSKRW